MNRREEKHDMLLTFLSQLQTNIFQHDTQLQAKGRLDAKGYQGKAIQQLRQAGNVHGGQYREPASGIISYCAAGWRRARLSFQLMGHRTHHPINRIS